MCGLDFEFGLQVQDPYFHGALFRAQGLVLLGDACFESALVLESFLPEFYLVTVLELICVARPLGNNGDGEGITALVDMVFKSKEAGDPVAFVAAVEGASGRDVDFRARYLVAHESPDFAVSLSLLDQNFFRVFAEIL